MQARYTARYQVSEWPMAILIGALGQVMADAPVSAVDHAAAVEYVTEIRARLMA
jgi:hypothetical protein